MDLGRYLIIIKDLNRILVRNTESGVTKTVYNLDQASEFIKNDIEGRDYLPEIKIGTKL